jgi:hypothetical protein
VHKVSLLGTADPGYWMGYLKGNALVPVEKEGRAQVLIIVASGRFWGCMGHPR